jgi:hypothetical protein
MMMLRIIGTLPSHYIPIKEATIVAFSFQYNTTSSLHPPPEDVVRDDETTMHHTPPEENGDIANPPGAAWPFPESSVPAPVP